jgi:DNA-binding transcriptional MerR regulator/effector-binding domain-containing protein
MFSIGEFSKISGLSVRTLRFYHEEGLLVPAAVDRETGYRSYDEANVERARVIVALRELEFSLDDIREIFAGCEEDGDLLAHLEIKRTSLEKRLVQLQQLVPQIDSIISAELSSREAKPMTKEAFDVQEKEIEPLVVAGVRLKGMYSNMGPTFGWLGRHVGRYIAGKPLCLYYDGEYREGDADFEPCFPLKENSKIEGVPVHELPAVKAVTLVHRGPYEELGRSYARLFKYVKERGYSVALPTREVYLKGPGMIFRGNPKKYLTEIQLPITA